MLYTAELPTCPVLEDPNDYHFELRCEDCDVQRLAGTNLGQVEGWYRAGRVTEEAHKAYALVWALLSPTGDPSRVSIPGDPTVLRIARKLVRAKGLQMPAVLAASV